MLLNLTKKITKKGDKTYTNFYLQTDGGDLIPIDIKSFGNDKQDYFRFITLNALATDYESK